MSSNKNPQNSEKFINRPKEFTVFSKLLKTSLRKALYIQADGGVGKTELLREFMKRCRDEGWNLGLEDVSDALIDFYSFENRTMIGLRRNIVKRVGSSFFKEYDKKDKELREESSYGVEKGREGRIANIELNMYPVFQREMEAISKDKIKPTALFFDTFELVHSRDVGRWLLQDFIPLANKIGVVIVFAGRGDIVSSENINSHPLSNFDKKEFYDYLKNLDIYSSDGFTPNEEEYFELSDGNPLISKLMYIQHWEGKAKEALHSGLIAEYINNTYPEKHPLYSVILEMSYLKRRFDKNIFEHRQKEYPGIESWDDLKKKIDAEKQKYPFIKYYKESDSFVLHDKFQEWMEIYGGGTFRDKSRELYIDVVKGLYETIIDTADDNNIKNLLRVEQLAYILDIKDDNSLLEIHADVEFAKKKIRNYFNINSYILDGFIVSEISSNTIEKSFLIEDRDEILNLLGQMANRIYRYEEAQPYWYSAINNAKSHKKYDTLVRRLLNLHGSTWRSDPNGALGVLEEARSFSQKFAKGLLPLVLNEIGFSYARYQDYNKAIDFYKKASKLVNKDKNKGLNATIINNLGLAYLHIGKWEEAEECIDSGKKLRQQILDEQILNGLDTRLAENRVAYSFSNLGRMFRYFGKLHDAEGNYTSALSIFDKTNEQSEVANIMLSRSEVYRELAARKFESGQFDDVKLYEQKADDDIQNGIILCQTYGLFRLLDTAYRHEGRLLHDKGYRSRNDEEKLGLYEKALKKFENALEKARDTKDVLEELECLREIAFLADDRADVIIHNTNDKKIIQEEFENLEIYISRFEEGLNTHKNDKYPLYSFNVFQSLLTLEKAAFEFSKEKYNKSLDLYLRAFVGLAKQSGYGFTNYLKYLPHLKKNLRKIKRTDIIKLWCDKIRNRWKKEKISQTHKEMIAMIDSVLLEIS